MTIALSRACQCSFRHLASEVMRVHSVGETSKRRNPILLHTRLHREVTCVGGRLGYRTKRQMSGYFLALRLVSSCSTSRWLAISCLLCHSTSRLLSHLYYPKQLSSVSNPRKYKIEIGLLCDQQTRHQELGWWRGLLELMRSIRCPASLSSSLWPPHT